MFKNDSLHMHSFTISECVFNISFSAAILKMNGLTMHITSSVCSHPTQLVILNMEAVE